MIEIVVSVCSIVQGATCKDVRLTYMAESVSPMECMMKGQVEMAKWAESHPNWRIHRWSCGVPRQVAKI